MDNCKRIEDHATEYTYRTCVLPFGFAQCIHHYVTWSVLRIRFTFRIFGQLLIHRTILFFVNQHGLPSYTGSRCNLSDIILLSLPPHCWCTICSTICAKSFFYVPHGPPITKRKWQALTGAGRVATLFSFHSFLLANSNMLRMYCVHPGLLQTTVFWVSSNKKKVKIVSNRNLFLTSIISNISIYF